MFENVNGRTTYPWVSYKLTGEPSAQVSYKWGKTGVGIKMIKKIEKKSIFLHKIICCGCALESPHRGDSNTHPKHMILWKTNDN